MALEHRAVLAALTADFEFAAHLLGYTDGSLRRFGAVREETERAGFERARSVLVEHFGAEALEERLAAGAAMSDDEALAYGLNLRTGAGAASSP